jgi:hypothetical protein
MHPSSFQALTDGEAIVIVILSLEAGSMSKYSIDVAALMAYERTALQELDEQIDRNFQREIEQKRRELEEAKKKKAKKKRFR